MKKIGFVVCFILSLFMMVNTALGAGEVKLSLSSKDTTVYIGDLITVDAVIENNQYKSDTFSITVFPSYWYGIRVDLQNSFININAKSNVTTKVYFDTRSSDPIISPFTITVESINNKNIKDSDIFKLTVLRKSPVYIYDIIPSKYTVIPGDMITIDNKISNTALVAMGPYNIQTNIKYGNALLKRFDDSIDTMPASSMKKISNTYMFDKYASPGKYFVETIIKDENNFIQGYKITEPINVTEVSKLVKEKSVEYGLMSQTITLKVKNEGNILASNFYVTESVPQFVKNLFYPQVEPDKEEKKDVRVVYYWFVDKLSPGQEKIIKYEIRSINIIIIFVLLILFVMIAFKYVFSPKIVKRARHFGALTREKEVIVSIETRNRSRHEMKDVIVRDFVPSITTVVERFDTLKPNVRKTEGGTELIWRFESLKPFEERVITYRIKPIVEVAGTLKLPKARVTYMDKKKQRKGIASKSVWIKAR
jgi:hypothetical protein